VHDRGYICGVEGGYWLHSVSYLSHFSWQVPHAASI
jgi:hypothetical protein